MSLPPFTITAPPAPPIPAGLYSAATLTSTDQARFLGGLEVHSPNTGGHGTWPTGCPAPGDMPDKGGQRTAPLTFDATIAWAVDECKTVGITEDEARDRAVNLLRLTEPLDVEKDTAEKLKIVRPARTAGSFEDAVEQIEDALAADGYAGVIHARRGLLAHLPQHLVVRQGAQLFTPGGHRWAFGAGYESLGDTLVGTGPVHIVQGPVSVDVSVNSRNNLRTALAERAVAVGWEPPTIAVTVNRGENNNTGDTGTTGATLPSRTTLPGANTLPNGGNNAS